ncbi:MAG: IMP dehydrogenase [Parcubacteria group bacterium]|nr:IMP dehydrogenase [Parcubacteria group bacterium]
MGTHACDSFFDRMAELALGLEFNDVKLCPSYSDFLPADADTASRFSRNVPLKVPIVSAAMDNVTEAPMAIAMAKAGGLGIIHRNLTPKEQGAQVRIVKRHLNGLIERPITARTTETIEAVLNRRRAQGFTFHKFPVINEEGRLAGILTKDDFEFCDDPSKKVGEVMTTELITAPPDTPLNEAYVIMLTKGKKALPLVSAHGELAGMYDFSDVKRLVSGGNSTYNLDAKGRLRVGAAIGVGENALKYIEAFPDDIDVVVIDTAHGDSKAVIDTIRMLKSMSLSCDVVAGNISRADAALRLADAGADGIKVGQGPGSICTTQIVSGAGRCQLTAIHACARAVRSRDVPVCGDGGIRESGQITKAIGAGAHCVMLGSSFAGCDEAPSEMVMVNGNRMRKYRGMGSLAAMHSRSSRERYGQGNVSIEKAVPEGVEGMVAYAGSLAGVMHQLVGGLQAGMRYVGAKDIPALMRFAEFERVTQAGIQAAHPHGIMITADAPNYRRS